MLRALAGLLVLAALATLLVSLSRPQLPVWFHRLPEADPIRFFKAQTEARKVSLGNATRNAILAKPGAPVHARVQSSSGAGIEVAFALVCPEKTTCDGSNRFRIVARQDGVESVLLDETRTALAANKTGWDISLIGLDRLPPGETELEFSVGNANGPSPADHQNAPLPLWSEPLPRRRLDQPYVNVILISIDTLRADHLGSYGYQRETSPHLDALARDGVRFAQAISQAPWTTPSHMSLMTSLYPSAHRVNQDPRWFDGFDVPKPRYRALPAQAVTLAEILRDHGYQTVALAGGATVAGALGFAQGFDVYHEGRFKLTPRVWNRLVDWLAVLGAQPFFLFLHTFEVHTPYTHTEFAAPLLSAAQRQALDALLAGSQEELFDYTALRENLRRHLEEQGLLRAEITAALYDGGIRYTDAFLGRLFGELRQRQLFERTLIVVTSDHGEEFGEHDPARIYGAHGESLHDSLLHVPLIVHMPSMAAARGAVVTQQVELVDVAPTVLALLGLQAPPQMQGESLVPLMTGAGTMRKQWAVSESTYGLEQKALRRDDLKYVASYQVLNGERTGVPGALAQEELYNLKADPGEQHSLVEHKPRMTRRLRRELERRLTTFARGAITGPQREVSDETRERLRALGYGD